MRKSRTFVALLVCVSMGVGGCLWFRLQPSDHDLCYLDGSYTPSDIAVSQDGKKLYISDMVASEILVLSADNYKVKSKIPTDEPVRKISIDPAGISAMAIGSDRHLYIIDTARDEVVRSIDMPGAPAYAAVFSLDGTKVYVAAESPARLLTIDTKSGDLIDKFRVSWAPFARPTGMITNVARDRIYIATSKDGGAIVSVDPLARRVLRSTRIGGIGGIALSLNESTILVTASGEAGGLLLLDADSLAQVGRVPVLSNPRAVVLTGASKAYVSDQLDAKGELAVVDLASKSVIRYVATGGRVLGISGAPEVPVAYVVTAGSRSRIATLDTKSDDVRETHEMTRDYVWQRLFRPCH